MLKEEDYSSGIRHTRETYRKARIGCCKGASKLAVVQLTEQEIE
jgi:hypothetical protein